MVVQRMIVDKQLRGPRGLDGVNAIPADEFIAGVVEDPQSATAVALGQQFAAKMIEDIILAGRLEDTVLTNRFGRDQLRLGANRFDASSTVTVPTKGFANAGYAYWGLDQTNVETLSGGEVDVPKSWAAFDVYVVGAAGVAVTGGVRVRVSWFQAGPGDVFSAVVKTGLATLTVGPNINEIAQMKVLSVLRTDSLDTTKAQVFKVTREADDVADTLATDFRFTGLLLIPTAYVQFEPELPPEPEDLTGRTFTQAMQAELDPDIRIFQQAPPPTSDVDNGTYVYFPQTHALTGQNFTTSTWSGGHKGPFVWSNRRNYDEAWNKKPNPLPAPSVNVDGKQCRSVFTTLAKADAATRAQIRHLCGAATFDTTAVQADWIAAGGSSGDFVTEAAWRASPATYCTEDFISGATTYRVMVDKVVLPTPRLTSGANTSLNDVILLDYEVGDTRTPAWTQGFIEDIAADVQSAGRLLYLYTNPLTGATMPYHGIDGTNLPAILDAVDFISILLWSKSIEGSIAASYAAQLAKLGTVASDEWAKIALTFELGGATTPGTTLADAEWVYDKLHEGGSTHPTAVNFWRNYAQQGGAPERLTNQKISMICFGTETPPG